MSELKFRVVAWEDVAPEEWLRYWSVLYGEDDDYENLIAKAGAFSADDFEQIGRWKDNAYTVGKWQPNVASVAFEIWMQAATEAPKNPDENGISEFLNNWSERTYTDEYKERRVKKRFGLSRATTLLHFVSGGHFPIFDSRVVAALSRMGVSPMRETVEWYVGSCCGIVSQIAAACKAKDVRELDKALFTFGAFNFPTPPKRKRRRV